MSSIRDDAFSFIKRTNMENITRLHLSYAQVKVMLEQYLSENMGFAPLLEIKDLYILDDKSIDIIIKQDAINSPL